MLGPRSNVAAAVVAYLALLGIHIHIGEGIAFTSGGIMLVWLAYALARVA